MKNIYEKFATFKIRHNLSNEHIAQIAIEYANSDLELARTHFSEKYGISEYVFYKARDYAIIFCLVDNNTYQKIRAKSSTNYRSNNAKNSAASSIAHFDELLAQRNQFLNDFTQKEIIEIGRKYVDGVTLKNIAMVYETGEFAIKKLLNKGIISLIFDSYIVDQIKLIVGESLNTALKKREANKKALINCLEHQILFLKSQISCYNLYFRNIEIKPDLKCLETELENVIKMYNETLKL